MATPVRGFRRSRQGSAPPAYGRRADHRRLDGTRNAAVNAVSPFAAGIWRTRRALRPRFGGVGVRLGLRSGHRTSPRSAHSVTDSPVLLVAARAAASEGRWPDVYTALVEADGADPLAPDELELLASAATFSGRPDEASAARQRAFSLVRADQPRRAAWLAIVSAMMHLARNSIAVGMGWAQQAKELLADQGECEEAITFSLLEAMVASGSGQEDQALEAAEEIIIRARRLGAADDAKALATLLKGSDSDHAGPGRRGRSPGGLGNGPRGQRVPR